jgi:hypothetical protein
MTDEEFYSDLVKNGVNERDAARATDYRIAEREAKRRLKKVGLQRPPTDAEVTRILASM